MNDQPRGIRNNNPGNIRKTTDDWRGLLPAAQQTDQAFFRFESPAWGIRALASIMHTYQVKHGLKTVRAIISRWAPPEENDTEAYIATVAKAMGMDPEKPVDLMQGDTMRGLVLAIIKHENGQQPYAMSVINLGLRLAGVAA